jgi:hypothetical protein
MEDDDPLLPELCKVACSDSNIDLCYVKDIPALGDVSKVFAMNWRFFPMLDPQVIFDVGFFKYHLKKILNFRSCDSLQNPNYTNLIYALGQSYDITRFGFPYKFKRGCSCSRLVI